MNGIIELRAPLELHAPRPGKLPSAFDGIAYSGGVVHGLGVVIDLSTLRVADRLPVLEEHHRERVLGVVAEAVNDGRRLTVAGRLFSDMPGGSAERIASLAARGAPFQLSVGLYGYTEEELQPGAATTVNGATVVGPISILRRGLVREVSIVTLGADVGASARLFSSRQGLVLPTPRDLYARRRREAMSRA